MILWYTLYSYVLTYQLSGSLILCRNRGMFQGNSNTQNTAIKKETLKPWRSSSAVRPDEAFCGWHASLLIVLQCVLPKASLLHQVAQGVAARGSTLLLYMSVEDVELEQCLINTLQHKAAGGGYITVLVTLYCIRHLRIQSILNQLGSYACGISIARVRGIYEWVYNSSPWLQSSHNFHSIHP